MTLRYIKKSLLSCPCRCGDSAWLYRQFMGLKNMDMGPTLRMLRTLSESPTDITELNQAAAASSAFKVLRPEVAAIAAETAPAFMQSPVAKQYREVSSPTCSIFCALRLHSQCSRSYPLFHGTLLTPQGGGTDIGVMDSQGS